MPMTGEMKLSVTVGRIINRAVKIGDARKGLKLLATLVGRKVAQRYSGRSWKPYESWDGRVELSSFYGSDDIAIEPGTPLFKALRRTLPAGKVMCLGDVIVEHVPAREEGGSGTTMGVDQGGTNPRHLLFKKLSK